MLARRSVLSAGLAAGLVPMIPATGKAQSSERSRDVIQAIAIAKGQAENLLAMALYSNLSAENGAAIETANERIFSAITGIIGGIPAEEALVYAEPAQSILAEQMIEHGVALVPPARIPVIPTGGESQPGPEELNGIVAEVMKDALGVKDLSSSALIQAATQLGLTGILTRLAELIRSKNWALAAEFIRAALTQLASSAQTVPALQTAFGESAANEILANVNARLAPFLGWPIFIAASLYSIMKHRDSLVAAFDKERI